MAIEWNLEKAAVIGGNGFLGRYIVEELRRRGCGRVVSLSRRRDPMLEQMGVEIVQGDLRDPEVVENACRDATVVFHTAAKAGVWGTYHDYYGINVAGTANVLAACRRFGIRRLVYTSSPSVAYPPTHDIDGADESLPYPKRFLANYPATKAIAEKMVLHYDWKDLRVAALRPHLIWGPRDPHLLPRLIRRAAQRRLAIVGDGHNLVDLTYVVNAAAAHVQAAEMLAGAEPGFRRPYFISDDNPVKLWDWLNNLFRELKLPPVKRSISYATARRTGAILENCWKFFHIPGEPPMTPFVAGQLAFSHYFNIGAAKRDFQYSPVVTPEQAMQDTLTWLRQEVMSRHK